MTASAILRLADRAGLLPVYHQVDGTERRLGPETAEALLAAMGFDVGTDAAASAALAELEAADAIRTLPHEIVVRAGVPQPAAMPRGAVLRLEDGGRLEGLEEVPALPMGVHRLEAGGSSCLVIAAPESAPSVAELAGRDRIWGITAALYGLRSGRGTGVGDYADLGAAAVALAPAGAAFLGINPAHLRGVADRGLSPYSPSSRTAFDTGHIAFDRIPELADCAEARAHLDAAASGIAAARTAPLVEYGPRSAVAGPVLRALFATFTAAGVTPRAREFGQWLAGRPEAASRQSVFEALSLVHGADWRRWPSALQDPAAPGVTDWHRAHAAEVRFHDWCQWIAETQIAEAQSEARSAGMALGLYLDVAVGVRPGGAETWANPGAFATGCSLGAPPDALNSEGQAWDLAPFSPTGLRDRAYAPFRAMLAAAMAHAGMVRIDHVIGFHRSFWVPESGVSGGYVRFPGEVLMALTRIEATRARCLVVGEDLGTVPDGLREALSAAGLLGCAILPFERAGDGFADPGAYRPLTLAAFGTHDLPTIAGWWQGRDIEIRTELGHIAGEPVQWAWDEREWLRTRLAHLLAARGLLPPGLDPDRPPGEMTQELLDAVHRLLAAAGSVTLAAQLDDLFGAREQQNVPGTVAEQPNWRRPAPVAVEALARAPEIARAAEIFSARRSHRADESGETP